MRCPYHWLDHAAGSTLRFNYKGLGAILQDGDGYRYDFTWNGKQFGGKVRDWRKAKLWISRWLSPVVKVPVDELLRPRSE